MALYDFPNSDIDKSADNYKADRHFLTPFIGLEADIDFGPQPPAILRVLRNLLLNLHPAGHPLNSFILNGVLGVFGGSTSPCSR